METRRAQAIIEVSQFTSIKRYTTNGSGQDSRTRMHAETHFGEQPRTCFFMGNQNGIAFVIALVMLLVLTMIGLASVNMSSYESNIAGNERVYNLSFYGADGGFENFRARIAQGEFIYTPVNAGSYQVTIGDVTCNISYTRTIYSNAGGTYAVFKVRSVGQPPFPSQGSVTVESVVQTPLLQQQ